jgi:hypothetical protein
MFEATPTPDERQRKLEGLAFSLCKAATLVLIFQRYAIFVVPVLASVFYFFAYVHGVRKSRCAMRYPLLISAFWACVAIYVGIGMWVPGFKAPLPFANG